jgi:hypothetical protein
MIKCVCLSLCNRQKRCDTVACATLISTCSCVALSFLCHLGPQLVPCSCLGASPRLLSELLYENKNSCSRVRVALFFCSEAARSEAPRPSLSCSAIGVTSCCLGGDTDLSRFKNTEAVPGMSPGLAVQTTVGVPGISLGLPFAANWRSRNQAGNSVCRWNDATGPCLKCGGCLCRCFRRAACCPRGQNKLLATTSLCCQQ